MREWLLGFVVLSMMARLLGQVLCKTHVLMRDPLLNIVTSPSLSVAVIAIYLYYKE